MHDIAKGTAIGVKTLNSLKIFSGPRNHEHFSSLTNLSYLREKGKNIRKIEENGYTKTKKNHPNMFRKI